MRNFSREERLVQPSPTYRYRPSNPRFAQCIKRIGGSTHHVDVLQPRHAALISLKLCSSVRPEGKGSQTALRAIAALGSDLNPGMLGATDGLRLSCLKQRDKVSDDARRLSARSRGPIIKIEE